MTLKIQNTGWKENLYLIRCGSFMEMSLIRKEARTFVCVCILKKNLILRCLTYHCRPNNMNAMAELFILTL